MRKAIWHMGSNLDGDLCSQSALVVYGGGYYHWTYHRYAKYFISLHMRHMYIITIYGVWPILQCYGQ